MPLPSSVSPIPSIVVIAPSISPDCKHAGPDRLAVDLQGECTGLVDTALELCARHAEQVAQGRNRACPAVHRVEPAVH